MPKTLNQTQTFRFDEMAIPVNEKIDDPSKADVDHYVGLEHLDSNSLKIRRWGAPTDVEASKLVFKSGDIIFGKRRVYQRKLAIADFDGICSAHAMVLRAKTDAVLPAFLPFFMQSDLFMERALEISVGSLSPTINWTTLAKEEFALPPIEKQRRLVEVLQAIELNQDKLNDAIESTNNVLASAAETLCWKQGFRVAPVGEIAATDWDHFRDGDWIESKDQAESGIRLLQLADIGNRQFLDKSAKFITPETFERLNCTEVRAGDLLVARMAEPIGRTCIVPSLDTRCITAVDCCIVRLNKSEHNLDYWNFALNTASWTQRVASKAAGTTRARISRKNLESIEVPMPSRRQQVAIATALLRISTNRQELEKRQQKGSLLKRAALARISGGVSS